MIDPATNQPTAAERQTREHAQELFRMLPTLDIFAERVADLYDCRRIDETAEPLLDAAAHLRRAWALLVKAQALCAEADFSEAD